jgi:hypothetical protein
MINKQDLAILNISYSYIWLNLDYVQGDLLQAAGAKGTPKEHAQKNATPAASNFLAETSNFFAETSPQPVPDARVSLTLKPNSAILTLLCHRQTVRRLVRHTAQSLADSARGRKREKIKGGRDRTKMPNSRSVIALIHTRKYSRHGESRGKD